MSEIVYVAILIGQKQTQRIVLQLANLGLNWYC